MWLYSAMLLFLAPGAAFGQSPECLPAADTAGRVVILFPFDRWAVERGFMDNAQGLDALHGMMSDAELISGLDSIVVTASVSPDGNPLHNRRLSRLRANSIRDFILENYPAVDTSVISVYANPGYWEGLVASVESDPAVPARDAFLAMLRDPGLSDYAKNQRMAAMQGGAVFAYIRDSYMLRRLRQGSVRMILRPPVREPQPDSLPEILQEPQPEPAADTVAVIPADAAQPVPESLPVAAVQHKPPAAFRTNLLLDVMGVPNLGVEVPVGGRFSVAGDFAYAYAHIRKNYAMQTIQGTLEGRYWFKPRRNLLTGWNLGVYGTYCSRFDVRWGGGVQGDGYWSAGLTGGYSIPLSNSFNLDLSIAGGYFHSPEIRQYGKARNGHLRWEKTMYNVSRIALTQVRIDLVWLMNKKVK